MANTTTRKVGYFYVNAADNPGEGARVLAALTQSGVNLLAFHAFPSGAGQAQLNFVPTDEQSFQDAAKKARLKISDRKTAFLVEGDDRPGAVADLLQQLASTGTNITAMDAVKAGQRFGVLLWVKPADPDKAAKALRAT